MFKLQVLVTMPFCKCGDSAQLVAGVRGGDPPSYLVRCDTCLHQESVSVTSCAATVVALPVATQEGPNRPDND